MPSEPVIESLSIHAIPADLLSARRLASERWLRAILHGVPPIVPSLRVAEAVAFAPRNVHAIGIGRKVVTGVVTGALSVRFYVVQKLPSSLLNPEGRIPQSIEGVPTDVIESAPAFMARGSAPWSAGRRSRQRPAPAGISVAHHEVTAGTIGCYCRSTRDGEEEVLYLLGNNHVLADLGQARVGDDVLQPGPADGGTAADRFAILDRFAPLVTGGMTPNNLDAALARVIEPDSIDPSIYSIGRVGGTDVAAEEMRVRKHGRTTGFSEGVVTDIAYEALVGVGHRDPSLVALFEDQIRIDVAPPYPAFALAGDSGSLLVTGRSRRAVGLYFAGSPSGDYGVANPIDPVLSALEITLL